MFDFWNYFSISMGFQSLKHRSYKQTYNLKKYIFKKFHSSPAIYSQNTPIPSIHILTDKKYEQILLFHIPSLKIVSFLYKVRDFSRKTPLSFLMLDMQLFGDKKNSFCFKRHKKHWKINKAILYSYTQHTRAILED